MLALARRFYRLEAHFKPSERMVPGPFLLNGLSVTDAEYDNESSSWGRHSSFGPAHLLSCDVGVWQ
jgi:hypothetical protein